MKIINRLYLIVIVLVFLIPVNIFATQDSNIITIDGQMIEFNDMTGRPFIDNNNRTQVPFRITLETFGAVVSWNKDTRTAIAEKDGVVIEIPIGKNYLLVNGEIVANDTIAIIENGKTYLPIRKVLEAFGCEVIWVNDSNTVKVITKELNKLRSQIIFENDIRTFTLYAFMNYTGYNDENNKLGFHKVREMVRSDLENLNLNLIDENFYINTGKDYSCYKRSLKKIGAPPNFTPIQSLGRYEVPGIDRYLEEFYEKANIEELYKKYKPYYDIELEKYSFNVYEAIAKTNKLLRIDVPNSNGFYVEVNLLDAYWRGSGLGSIDLYKNKGVIITGPSDEPNILNITHEYLHGVINPIIDNLNQDVNAISSNMKYIQYSDAVVNQGYNSWNEIVIESFIRALSTKTSTTQYTNNMIQQETDDGFLLSKYVFYRFNEYNSFDGSLEDFMRKILREYRYNKYSSYQ